MIQLQAPSWPQKAQRLIQQDPRKAGLLGALLLVLAFTAFRLISSGETTPSTVQASHEGLQVGPQSLLTNSNTPDADGATLAGGASTPVLAWLDMPAPPLTRNPFQIRYEIFPPEVIKSEPTIEGRGFWDEIAKSLTVQVDQEEKKHVVLQAVQTRASRLQVASVIMGPTPRAMIDDKLVGEGDVVANFRVLKIEARRIIVESEGIRLEIQMK